MPTTIEQQAMFKAMIGQLDQDFLQLVKAELRDQVLEECREEALALARQELEDTRLRDQERLRDAVAKHRALVEDELEGELERREAQLRQEVRDEYEERLITRRDERDTAIAERDRAEVLLVGMVKELCSGRNTYLYSGGAGLRNLDLVALNETLGKHQLRLKARMSYSERIVNCRVNGDEWRGRTKFSLESVASDVDQEPDETEPSPETPEPQAVPAG